MGGNWITLANAPFNAGHMLLLTDGTVLVQEVSKPNWYRLTPDRTGLYVSGTWTKVASSSSGFTNSDGSTLYAPEEYGSAVLADGRVFFAGGEYNNGAPVNFNTCAIYDPQHDSWTQAPSPAFPGVPLFLADPPLCVLPDGRVLVGATASREPTPAKPNDFIAGTVTAIFDPVTATWTRGPDNAGSNWEATWTLMSDGTVLCPSVNMHPQAYKYVPAAAGSTPPTQWVRTGDIPTAQDVVANTETGPCMLLFDGSVVAFGATGHTAIYTAGAHPADAGSWAAGPDFPGDPSVPVALRKPCTMADAPAAMLPSGRVLCIAGAPQSNGFSGPPALAFEFIPKSGPTAASIVAVAAPGNGTTHETQDLQLLLLPTGEVMATAGGTVVCIYQPDAISGTPPAAAWPTITNAPPTVQAGAKGYTLTGTQLNGLSQANSFGDDASNATNYPLVRIRNIATGQVCYCRTYNHSSMGVATGITAVTTHFDVPSDIASGPSQLFVVANGIASKAQTISVVEPAPTTHKPVYVFVGIYAGAATADGGGFVVTPEGTIIPISPDGPVESGKELLGTMAAIAKLNHEASALPQGAARQAIETRIAALGKTGSALAATLLARTIG